MGIHSNDRVVRVWHLPPLVLDLHDAGSDYPPAATVRRVTHNALNDKIKAQSRNLDTTSAKS